MTHQATGRRLCALVLGALCLASTAGKAAEPPPGPPPVERAVFRRIQARDIRRAVLPLRPGDFDSKRIRQLIRKRDYSALEAVFANFPESHQLHGVTVSEAKLPGMHQEARDRRGRIRKFQGKALVITHISLGCC